MLTKASSLIRPNGDPVLEREQVIEMAHNQPDRVSYIPGPVSKPNFKKVLVDGEYTGFVRCFRCPQIQIQKHNSKAGNMLNHNKRSHPEVVEQDRKLNRNATYHPLDEEEVNRRLEKAAEHLKNDPDPDRYKYCYVPSGKVSKKGQELFLCCYCDHETAVSVSNMKGHLNHTCPGVPDDIREEVKNSKSKTQPRRKRRWKKRPIDFDGSNGGGEDSDDYSDSDATDVEMEEGEKQKWEAEKAVKILSRLLVPSKHASLAVPAAVDYGHDGPSTSNHNGFIGHDGRDYEDEVKELKVKKLRMEIKESELRMKHEELKIKSKELLISDKAANDKLREEKVKFYQGINQRLDKLINIFEKDGLKK